MVIRREPDLFLVGAPRCGTTSLYAYLKQHPEIYLSVLKEPHFFSTDLTPPPQAVTDKDLYLGLFSSARGEARLGEGSVWYLASREAPKAIRATSPDARILVCLRDPVEMIHSLHSLYLRTGNEDLPDLEEALDAEEARSRGDRIPRASYFPEGLRYTWAATYHDKLKRYFDIFGRERVHVVLFDDLVAEPAREYRLILEHLGVDPSFEAVFDPTEARRRIRTRVIRQLRHAPPEIRESMKGGGRRHVGRRAPMNQATRDRLNRHFTPQIEGLAHLLGRSLPDWCRARTDAAGEERG